MERRLAFGAAAASLAVIAVAAQFSLDHGPGVSLRDVSMPRDRAEIDANKAPAGEARRADQAEPVAELVPGEISELSAAPPPQPAPPSRAEPASPPVSIGGSPSDPAVSSDGTISAGGNIAAVPLSREVAPAGRRSNSLTDTFLAAPANGVAGFAKSAGSLAADALRAPGTVFEPMPVPAVESTGGDRFTEFDANPVRTVAEAPVSTFSIDVDTASYAFVRRMLREGALPPEDAVRVEEMVNYFDYGYLPAASAEAAFQPSIGLFPAPWNPKTQLLRIGIKGYEVAAADKPRANLVFLIDVSGSMDAPDKLPLLKNAFRLLLDTLGPDDTVAIVTYAGTAGTALEPTKAAERGKILDAIDGLGAGGSTAGAAGIEAAYRLAADGFVKDGINRVILATDGDFNVGISDPAALEDYIERRRDSGVYLSVLGFGTGNYDDALMQALAQNGNGNAAYIDTLNEARKVLVDEAGSTLVPIASDVKIQVEFNPATVAEYRLIGYETRALAREDFNNDRVDAGEIGSGHSVTALYELTPVGSPARLVDPLRYGSAPTTAPAPAPAPTAAGTGEEIAFLRLRYKRPGEAASRLIETPISASIAKDRVADADEDARFAAAVAAFGQKLRANPFLADYDYEEIAALASGARGQDPFGYRNEFLSLVRLAGALDAAGRRR